MKGRLTIPRIESSAEVNQYTPLSRKVAVMVGSAGVPRSLIFIGSEITGPKTVRYPMDWEASRTPINFVVLTDTCSLSSDADQVVLWSNSRRTLRPRTIGKATRIAFSCASRAENPTCAITQANSTSATTAATRWPFFIGLTSPDHWIGPCDRQEGSGCNQSCRWLTAIRQKSGFR